MSVRDGELAERVLAEGAQARPERRPRNAARRAGRRRSSARPSQACSTLAVDATWHLRRARWRDAAARGSSLDLAVTLLLGRRWRASARGGCGAAPASRRGTSTRSPPVGADRCWLARRRSVPGRWRSWCSRWWRRGWRARRWVRGGARAISAPGRSCATTSSRAGGSGSPRPSSVRRASGVYLRAQGELVRERAWPRARRRTCR